MRKVTSGMFVSLDGVAESPDRWQGDLFDQDMMQAMGAAIANMDTALMGRVTYQEWQPFWPTSQDEPYASFINNIPKFVFSKTLDRVDWQNTTLVKSSLVEKVNELKRLPGKDIGVQGSITVQRFLIENDLLDELTLLVHPVVVGQGKRFFKDSDELKRFKLIDCKASGSGVVMATYQPR